MKTLISNAFTTMPVQDKFGGIGFPSNGLTKLEYFALEIYICKRTKNPSN